MKYWSPTTDHHRTSAKLQHSTVHNVTQSTDVKVLIITFMLYVVLISIYRSSQDYSAKSEIASEEQCEWISCSEKLRADTLRCRESNTACLDCESSASPTRPTSLISNKESTGIITLQSEALQQRCLIITTIKYNQEEAELYSQQASCQYRQKVGWIRTWPVGRRTCRVFDWWYSQELVTCPRPWLVLHRRLEMPFNE